MTCLLRSTGITPLQRYYGQFASLRRIGTFGLAVGAACAFSLSIAGKVLTPPICRTPLEQSQASPELIPGDGSAPGFDIT